MSATFITMEKPATGEIRQVKIGLAWDCFFAMSLTYSPFFYRRIYKWAFISFAFSMVIITILAILFYASLLTLPDHQRTADAIKIASSMALFVTTIITYIFHIYFLIKGNVLTAQSYYRKGFRVINNDKNLIALAEKKLKLPKEAFAAYIVEKEPAKFTILVGKR